MTVDELIDVVLGIAFPRKFNASMLAVKRHHVIHGLTELQRRVEGFRVANIDFTAGSFDLMVSGATVFPAPRGIIEQVVVGNDGCESIFPDLMPRGQIQQFQADWAHQYGCGIPATFPLYPQGRVVWARDDDDLMVYPWVPVPWTVGVRWRGIRRDWPNEAEVWWGELVTEALRLYVLWKSAVDDNCDPNQILVLKQDFTDEAAKLKSEDFQIRHPAPGETYASEVMGRMRCVPGVPVVPPVPGPVLPPYNAAFDAGFTGLGQSEPPAPRDVTTAKTRSQLDSELQTLVNDNTSGDISPADLREAVGSSNYSAVNKVDETTTYSLGLLKTDVAASARSFLGLGNSAPLNVGTTAGTVAAGDHTHPAPAVPDFIQVRADNGVVVNLYVKFKEGAYTIKPGQPT